MDSAGVLAQFVLRMATDAPVEVGEASTTTGAWTPSVWVAIVACIVAVVAVVPSFISLKFSRRAAKAASDSADAAMAQTELQARIAHESLLPRLWCDIRPHPVARDLMFISIGNSGPTNAHDVRVTIDPPLQPAKGWERECDQAQSAVRAGIATLTPGRTMEYKLGLVDEVVRVNLHVEEFNIVLTGRSSDGHNISIPFALRMQDAHKTTVVGGGSLRLVSDKIDQLRSEVTKISKAVSK